MDLFENSLESSFYEEAAPKAHAYSLIRVKCACESDSDDSGGMPDCFADGKGQ
jgi:hypothetical protein